MINKDYYEWVFASLDDIIDCCYEPFKEEFVNEHDERERSVKIVDDTRKSRQHDS